MWINVTSIRLQPDKLSEVVQQLYEDEEMLGKFRQLPGFRFSYLMKAADKPGEFLSLTVWDDSAAATAYFTSPLYQEVLERLAGLYQGTPRSQGYEVAHTFSFSPEPARF